MITLWYNEAGKYHVLPIDSRGTQRIAEERPQIALRRPRYVLYPGTQSIPADVDAGRGADGVLLSMGGNDGGISFYVQGGRLCFVFNYVALQHHHVKAQTAVPEGRHFLGMEFTPTGKPDPAHGKGAPGTVRLLVDGKEVARGEIPITSPIRLGQGGAMLVGADTGSAITPDYKPPFRYGGRIHRVVVDVSGEHVEDHEAQLRIALAKQ